MPISREVHLITRPNGMPQASEFEIVETNVPDAAEWPGARSRISTWSVGPGHAARG